MQFAYYGQTTAAHPHNSILLVASEWGIPAAVIAFSLAAYGIISWIMHCRRKLQDPAETWTSKQLKVAPTASLIAARTHSLVSGILVMPVSQVIMAVVAGLMIGIYQSDKNTVLQEPSRRTVAFARAQVAVMAIMLIVTVAPDMPHLNQRINDYHAAHPGAPLEPRFWQQGVIGR